MILALLALILTLILVVGIHEIGHAIMAQLFKVKIKRIAIGFGKPLFAWKDRANHEWVWGLWPLGGYVELLNSRIGAVAEKELNQCFDKKPVWQRCMILLAGPLANLVGACLALTMMYMLGFEQHAPFIQEVKPQSLAAQAGLQANERFITISGQKTNSWQEVGMGLMMAIGKTQVPVLLANKQGDVRKVNLNLEQWRYKKEDQSILTSLGIKAASGALYNLQIAGQSFFEAIHSALEKMGYLLLFFLVTLKLLLTKVLPFSVLLGPLGLFSVSINSFLQGLSAFLYFIASFSLAVGLVNLFPIPGLDGCSIIYALSEKWLGKPVSVAFEILLYRFSVIIFTLLLVQLIINDLQPYLK